MPATTTPASASGVTWTTPPVWHYARQIVSGTVDVPMLDKISTSATAGRAVFVFKYRLP